MTALEIKDLTIKRLQGDLQYALSLLTDVLALTDTGSLLFRTTFPPKSAGEAIYPQEIVPGWRIVEKIREVLLTANLSMK